MARSRGNQEREKRKKHYRDTVFTENAIKELFELLAAFWVSVVRNLSSPASWRGGRSGDHGKQHYAVLATKVVGQSIGGYGRVRYPDKETYV